jgi:hypothetical protein
MKEANLLVCLFFRTVVGELSMKVASKLLMANALPCYMHRNLNLLCRTPITREKTPECCR